MIKESSNWLDIFILCHNRYEAVSAIESIVPQITEGVRLVISDNSTDPKVSTKIQRHAFGHDVKKRGGITAVDHINLCVSEVEAEYYCLFHDDDLFLDEFVKELFLAVRRFNNASALATNAIVYNALKGEEHSSFTWDSDVRIFDSPNKLLMQYFAKNNSGIAPFPSYVYKKYNGIIFKNIGKYSDVIFVYDHVDRGEVIWINKPLIQYNIHGQNDGLLVSIKDRLKLLGWMKAQKTINSSVVSDFRLMLFREYRLSRKKLRFKAKMFIFFHRIRRRFRK